MIKKVQKKKPGISFLFLILCLSIASIGINIFLFKDALWSIIEPNSSFEVTAGNFYNPFTNFTFESVISRISGRIPILEYHIINTPWVETNLFMTGILRSKKSIDRYVVSSQEFRAHLEQLYLNNFRNISLDEYLSLAKGEKKDINRIPPESKLYIITFDDAGFGQFDFDGIDKGGKPVIDPNCAVGIMLDFARDHPDFKLNAAFNIDFSDIPFQQEKYVSKKLNMLLDYGFEILNHTKNHVALTDYFPDHPELAAFELGRTMELFESYLGYRALTINKVCYPNGAESEDLWNFITNFKYNGKEYSFIAGIDADGLQARNPNETNFNPYRIARIETSKYTFNTFILKAPNLFKTPPLMERKTQINLAAQNKPWTLDNPELIKYEQP